MSLPPFPAEIWRAILRFSVEIPQSLDTKWDYSPDDALWDHWEWQPSYYPPSNEKDRAYYSALQTKLSIVQVSRSWREIGLELLYEYLLFSDQSEDDDNVEDFEDICRPIAMVAAIFEQHANECGSGYGQATKHIDVPLSAFDHSVLPTLIRLLNLCHNLRVFILRGWVYREVKYDGTGLSDLTLLLQTRFRHSLRRLSFDLDDINMSSSPLDYHLILPNLLLDSLKFGAFSSSPFQPPPAITTVSVLTVPVACLSLQNMALWHCPALRHITLIIVTEKCDLSFLISHGPQLISLALFPLGDHISKIGRLSRLIAPATNLRSLVFDLRYASELLDTDIFPSITHIGIRLNVYKTHWKYSSTPFSTSIFPRLQ